MSVTRHHADWLSLIEVSGPFISLPVLQKTFPQGLEPRDPAQAKLLRAAYEEWQDNPTAPGKQRAWVMHVLIAVLGYPEAQIAEGQSLPAGLEASMPEMGETLRPDFALVGPAGADTASQPQLLIASYPAEQSLDKPVIGKHWKATPATRMMELLHGANVPLGLVTNGEHWMLVYAPRGETTGYASWYGALWLDEPITLRAFHSLLGVRRFFGVAADSTLLALLKESASDQQEVTDQLGYQVREAVEVLVQSFDALDKESNRETLKGIQPATVYDAALTIMMRLVFLFSAEERGLLHLGKPLYDDNYAVSTLQAQLQEVADRYGEEVLERRYDAWARLLATFRAVHGGIQHQDLLMQAYGGSLFDPDRYPFLEGRAAGSHWRSAPAEPLAVNNRVVLHLLNSLQRLRTKVGAGGTAETRRVSFRALGVEQIGHVYEGLLDHTAFRATEVVLGIRGTRKKEPEVALSTLEDLLRQGEDKLLDFLKEETDRSLPALRKELNNGALLDEHKLLVACDHDEALVARLRPFAGLIRDDSFERPWVVLPGSIFVTAGTARRSTGTHYTPPSLTEPIVQHTLEPLVYVGPDEGLPKEQWKLKSPKEILDLKVCDMAMGSGAFLVQACRYLAERLVEAWENEEKSHPGQVLITPDGKFSEGSPSERLVPAEAAERIAIARRVVADRCLYGVDINPMAVEMAKLSMWLITVDANRPFTFLDHAFKCGDSLLGITSLEQLENFSLRPGGGKQQAFATLNLWRHIDEAKKKREMLEAMPSDTPEQIAQKAALYIEAEESIAKLIAAGDILVGLEMRGLNGAAYESTRQTAADHMMAFWARGLKDLQGYAEDQLGSHRCMHWPLAFPEIMSRGGFDAFIGNPPFLGNRLWKDAIGDWLQGYVELLLASPPGKIDLCVVFNRRCCDLLREGGNYGLLSASNVAEGSAISVGLGVIVQQGDIYRAMKGMPWPGVAAVIVAVIHFHKGQWQGRRDADGSQCERIGPRLECEALDAWIPQVLQNAPFSFVGVDNSKGLAFVVTSDHPWFARLRDEKESLLCPYITGDDITSSALNRVERYALDIADRDLQEIQRRWPDAYQFLMEVVKPTRTAAELKSYKGLIDRWWQFWNHRAALMRRLRKHGQFIAFSKVTKYPICTVADAGWLYTNQVLLIEFARSDLLALCLSSPFRVWLERYAGGGLGVTLRISISESVAKYPVPDQEVSRAAIDAAANFNRLAVQVSATNRYGLTEVMNRIHSPNDNHGDIVELRRLLGIIDQEVAASYGWQDLDLQYRFEHLTEGTFFTVSLDTRQNLLERLGLLNKERFTQEQSAPPVASLAAPRRGRPRRVAAEQMGMDL